MNCRDLPKEPCHTGVVPAHLRQFILDTLRQLEGLKKQLKHILDTLA